MPQYAQIQTYVTCDQDSFIEIIERYRTTLQQLGCTDEKVITWLSEIQWPDIQNEEFGDIYASSFTLAPGNDGTITCAGLDIAVYGQPGVPTLEEPPTWLGLNLLFDQRNLCEQHSSIYRSGVGGSIWQIMRTIAGTMKGLGVYFTDEWQENQSWRVLAERVGDPWVFDLAIFPRSLADQFAEVPAGFQGTIVDNNFAFAQENRWRTLPWIESEK